MQYSSAAWYLTSKSNRPVAETTSADYRRQRRAASGGIFFAYYRRAASSAPASRAEYRDETAIDNRIGRHNAGMIISQSRHDGVLITKCYRESRRYRIANEIVSAVSGRAEWKWRKFPQR